jgi:uncharacterized membrane protein YcgQ (UPF0703/DUF1980 family)
MKQFIGLGLMLTVAVALFTGCGDKQGDRLSGKTNKNGTNSVTLSGYAGTANSNTDEVLAGLTPDQSEGVEVAVETSPRVIKDDSKYQANQGFLEIKEKMFIAQINDIYLNPEDYIGKTLKLEGIFQVQQAYTINGNPYYFVIRYGPGCCGSDGNAGFEVMWENGEGIYPQENDWVEAVGVLKYYEEDEYPYLCISLSGLKALEKRGAEFVTQ